MYDLCVFSDRKLKARRQCQSLLEASKGECEIFNLAYMYDLCCLRQEAQGALACKEECEIIPPGIHV